MLRTYRQKIRDRKGKWLVTGIVCTIIAVVAVVLIFAVTKNRKMSVGTDIACNDISEFVYTHASTAFPPQWQRYRFYAENDKLYFYCEKREGNHLPLTETDITESGSAELSQQQTDQLYGYLQAGTVTKRSDSTESGSSGPWMYLYWKGDKDIYQQFSFDSGGTQTAFEQFCQQLALQCADQ